jgi:hypothetical protein
MFKVVVFSTKYIFIRSELRNLFRYEAHKILNDRQHFLEAKDHRVLQLSGNGVEHKGDRLYIWRKRGILMSSGQNVSYRAYAQNVQEQQ